MKTQLFSIVLCLSLIVKNQASAQEAKANWAFNAYMGVDYTFYRVNISESNGWRFTTEGLQLGASRQKKRFYQELILMGMNKGYSSKPTPIYDSTGKATYSSQNYVETRNFDFSLAYQAGRQLIGNEDSKFKLLGGVDLVYRLYNTKNNEVLDGVYTRKLRYSAHQLTLGVFSKASYRLGNSWSVNMTLCYNPIYSGMTFSRDRDVQTKNTRKFFNNYFGAFERNSIGLNTLSGRIGIAYRL